MWDDGEAGVNIRSKHFRRRYQSFCLDLPGEISPSASTDATLLDDLGAVAENPCSSTTIKGTSLPCHDGPSSVAEVTIHWSVPAGKPEVVPAVRPQANNRCSAPLTDLPRSPRSSLPTALRCGGYWKCVMSADCRVACCRGCSRSAGEAGHLPAGGTVRLPRVVER